MTINIYYTKFTKHLPSELLALYTNMLPPDLKIRNSGFLKWQDKHSNLFGKLLLIQGIKDIGANISLISKMNYDEYNRPYLSPEFDFNISHSGDYVLCAIGENIKLGIDIEKIRDLDFNYFNKTMTNSQWYNINLSEKPLSTFFHYWSIKESVIKADGKGLSISLLDINIENNIAQYNNRVFYLNRLGIDEDYSAYLATTTNDTNLLYNYVNFY